LKFSAEPDGGNDFQVIQSIDEDYLVPDLEGLSIYYGADGSGYLIANSQGDSSYAVFNREGDNAYLGSFVVGANGPIDQANESDGLDVINVSLGSAFPNGLLVVQDGANDPQNAVEDDEELENNSTNFKLVPWENVAEAFPNPLDIDTTSYDPRNPVQALISGSADGETLVGDDVTNILNGFGGDDTLAGELAGDIIYGGTGDDVLRGDRNVRSAQAGEAGGDDVIFGGDGNDRIGGKSGNDRLFGDAGNDQIWGDDGDDLLRGGLGNDTLTGDDASGGQGSDTFVFAMGEGTDTITDFEIGIDLIGLADGLSLGQLAIRQQGNDALISVGAETLVLLQGVQSTMLDDAHFVVV
ncbi:MAG: phytase, partial [Cyanobacteria bacterium J06659_2]